MNFRWRKEIIAWGECIQIQLPVNFAPQFILKFWTIKKRVKHGKIKSVMHLIHYLNFKVQFYFMLHKMGSLIKISMKRTKDFFNQYCTAQIIAVFFRAIVIRTLQRSSCNIWHTVARWTKSTKSRNCRLTVQGLANSVRPIFYLHQPSRLV